MAPVHQKITAVADARGVITWRELQLAHVVHAGFYKGWHNALVRDETGLQTYQENREVDFIIYLKNY